MGRPRNSKTSARIVTAREREAEAFELRKRGLGYRAIGRELGVTMQAAHAMVKRVLQGLSEETKEHAMDVLELELSRIDELIGALWEKAKSGHESSIDRVLRLMDRRARYLGLNRDTMIMDVRDSRPAEERTTEELWEILDQFKRQRESRESLAASMETEH